MTHEDVETAVSILTHPTVKRMIGKAIGKKVATAVAVVIAVQIAKSLAMSIARSAAYRRLLRLRPTAKSNNLAGVLITLLKSNGLLGQAGQASRRLKTKSPRLWTHLRNRAGGLDMMYFVVEGFTKEYVDRISLLEKDPVMFARIMEALITSGDTQNIIVPHKTSS